MSALSTQPQVPRPSNEGKAPNRDSSIVGVLASLFIVVGVITGFFTFWAVSTPEFQCRFTACYYIRQWFPFTIICLILGMTFGILAYILGRDK